MNDSKLLGTGITTFPDPVTGIDIDVRWRQEIGRNGKLYSFPQWWITPMRQLIVGSFNSYSKDYGDKMEEKNIGFLLKWTDSSLSA